MITQPMNLNTQIFPIKPPPRSTMFFAWGVVAFLFGILFYFTTMIDGMAWLFASIFLPIIVVFIIVAMATRKTQFEISNKGLEITGDWCGDTLAWRDMDIPHARIVQFDAEPGLKPKWKTAGLAMPGYCSGWFRLYDKSKALIFLTDKKEAIYLPTRKDFCVLLSSTDNSALLQTLQQFGKN
jgi:hypothetical protein